MLSAGHLSCQLASRHPQPFSQASSLSPAPTSSSSTAGSLPQQQLLGSPQVSSQGSLATYAAPDPISPNRAFATATTAKASIAVSCSGNNRSQLNELGSGRQLCGAPAAPAVTKELQKHQAGQQTPPHAITAPGPIVPGKFYRSTDYSAQCRRHPLAAHPHQQQQHQAPLPSANSDPQVAALPVPSLSRAEHLIQAPPCYHNPSSALVSEEPPSLPPLFLQKAQQQRHRVRRREVTIAATQVVMEPGIHTQPLASASYSSPYSQSTSSSQQYPQIRTDTTLASSINSSSIPDPASKSTSAVVAVLSSGSSCGGLHIAAPHSPVASPVHQPYPAREQQGHASYHHISPRGTSSPPRFAVLNTSMTCSSVNELGNPVLRRRLSNPNELYTSQEQNLIGQLSQQQQRCQTKVLPQPFERRNSDTMDTVSRSFNTHNDPELVGLPPMRHNDEEEEDEDEIAGHAGVVVGAAGIATTLYSKGFLIATSSAKESQQSHDNGGNGTYSPPHLHDGEERQPPCDDGEGSISQGNPSRGPTASASTAISHRLLTVEEINERRRASRVVSHSMSQAHFVVADAALGDSTRSQRKSKNPMNSTPSTNNNRSTASGVSRGSRPAHRQLTKEEADQLIAQRQQQRAVEAAATAKDTTALQQQQQQQHRPSSSLVDTSSTNNQSGVLHSSPSDCTKPWLLSGDGTQASYFPPAPASAPSAASTNAAGSSGSNAVAKPMTFEWLRGTNGSGTGGGGGASGAGFFAESTAHSWPGVKTWRDSSAAGSSGSGGNVKANAAVAAFVGAAGGAAGSGGPSSDFGAPASMLARAGQAPVGTSTASFTWLPNTSNWAPCNQQQQTAFSFAPPAPSQVGSVGGATNAAPWDGIAGAIGLSEDRLQSGPLTYFPSLLTAAALQRLSQQHIKERICQYDVQLERLQQEREQLVQELQRRLHSAAEGEQQQHSHTNATSWSAMPSHGTVAEGTGAIGESGSAVDPNPLWQFFGDLVADGNVTRRTVLRGPDDKREPPGPCIEPVKGMDTEEWVGCAPAAAAERQRQSGTGAVGRGGSGSVGNWFAGERCGGRSRRRADTGNQRNNGDGSNNNGASSSAGAVATSSNTGGSGHSTNNRCSHDNTPQEQKYLQTDPFSMYMHNKKIATAGTSATPASSRDAAA